MPISITNTDRAHGPTCPNITVTVNDEGTSRTFTTSFAEIDELIDQLGGTMQAKKTLVLLWAAYRRAAGRNIINVVIA